MLIITKTEKMQQIELNQRTFGKATQKEIKKLVPSARTFKAISRDYVIKDEAGKTVATWHAPMYKGTNKNGLLVIV